MPTRVPPTPRDPHRSGGSVVGAAILLIVCCAAPVLLAAGVLGVVGAWLSNPWVIATAVVLLAAAGISTVARRRTSRARRSAFGPDARPSDLDRPVREDPRQQ
ncbi:hypothetical protein [Kribbella caucasensis]|uniref:hypothetical protein n=1 Tax=Kribbella caucasensis TaxID=2512215 RepID=UPI00105C717D|nr:hypothetical protein [Kribbella sp. VKM Ac-2527]